jgi:hypothetical protein
MLILNCRSSLQIRFLPENYIVDKRYMLQWGMTKGAVGDSTNFESPQ